MSMKLMRTSDGIRATSARSCKTFDPVGPAEFWSFLGVPRPVGGNQELEKVSTNTVQGP